MKPPRWSPPEAQTAPRVIDLYPDIEPYDLGMMPVGGDDAIYWETCGNPDGAPVLVIHGGPGSGCTPWHRRLFDSEDFRIVLFDQRGCGRSIPHASEPDIDLTTNNTHSLLADIERLRERLDIERWLIWGGSWGSTLALAYAESHPDRVSGMILWGVTTGRHCEFDWLFRGGLGAFFPQEWNRLRNWLPAEYRDGDLVEGYRQLVSNADPALHLPAAESWCLWESATVAWPPAKEPAQRFRDPEFALAFARIVTHYVAHNAWLEDGKLIRGAASLAAIRGVLVNGRFDFQAPLGNAWELQRVWPGADLVVVDNAGHAPDDPSTTAALIRAARRFATTH